MLEEQSVLGAILMNNRAFDEVNFLDVSDFSTSHQPIYQAMLDLAAEGTPIDLITVNKKIGDSSLIPYLTELSEYTPTIENAKYYARAVQESSVIRKGRLAAETILELSQQSYDNIEEYITEVEGLIESIKPKQTKGFKKAKDKIVETVDLILSPTENGIKTKFPKLDKFTKGLGRGNLIVIGARPSVGKTAFALQIALGVATQGTVGIFEMEMSEEELLQRMISKLTKINGKLFKDENKKFDEEQTDKITTAASYLGELPLYIDDTPGITIDYLISQSRRLKRERPDLSLIIIDYLTLMNITPKKNENFSKAVGRITNRIKRLARELDIPIILLAQLSRAVDGRASKRPILSDLRESGEIEQDADIVGFLHREEELMTIENGQVIDHVEFTIAKGRSIGISNFQFAFNGAIQNFKEK